MILQELYNFDDIYILQSKCKKITLLSCLVGALFLAVIALTVAFCYSNTALCVALVFVELLVGYFVIGVLFAIKLQRLKRYKNFLADMQSGLRVESVCFVQEISSQTTLQHQMDMTQIVSQMEGKTRLLFVEKTVKIPFKAGDKCQVQTVGDCLVAVSIYEV